MEKFKVLLILFTGVSAPVLAEQYDEPRVPSELRLRDTAQYYNDVIKQQREYVLPGEGPGEASARASIIGNGPGRVPDLPSDMTQVGRAGKLSDATRFAEHGEEAATASFTSIFIEEALYDITYCMTGTFGTGVCSPAAQADKAHLTEWVDKHGRAALAMEFAEHHNDRGRIRLLDGGTDGQKVGFNDSSSKGARAVSSSSTTSNRSGSTNGGGSAASQLLAENGLDSDSVIRALKQAEANGQSPSEAMKELTAGLSPSELRAIGDAARTVRQEAGASLGLSGTTLAKASGGSSGFSSGGSNGEGNSLSAGADLPGGEFGLEGDRGRALGSGEDRGQGRFAKRQRYYGGTIEPVTALGRFMATLKELKPVSKARKPSGRIQKIGYRQYLALRKLGIIVPRRGGNIFQRARATYRRFDRYRGTPLVGRKVGANQLMAFD